MLTNAGHPAGTPSITVNVNVDLRGSVGLDQERIGPVVVNALRSYERENGPLPIAVRQA